MRRLFVDTSAWYAYVNRRDPDHKKVRRLLGTFPGKLVTSNFVFDETVTFCLMRQGHALAAQVGDTLRDPAVVDLLRISADDETAAWNLFLDRPDKEYSFTDCTSFVLMRRLGLQQAASLDRDFQREGFEVLPAPRTL